MRSKAGYPSLQKQVRKKQKAPRYAESLVCSKSEVRDATAEGTPRGEHTAVADSFCSAFIASTGVERSWPACLARPEASQTSRRKERGYYTC